MNRNDKNKKFTALNINSVFKVKSVDAQNKTGYRIAGMQNIGKVSSMRRVPAPKWTPSIKAETGASENKQIINQTSSGWVNPSVQDGNEQNTLRNQLLNRDKNQWTSKAASNKPFFLMGQEFPSLPSDGTQDTDLNKDINKMRENDSVKSKLEDLRNRDNTISASTLNRIDALSISKSSKGDIAATGWAAEDEEPNFDEKIVFSDEESFNEVQNWHSDSEEIIPNKADNVRPNQHEQHDQQQQQQPSLQQLPISGDTWYEQSQLPSQQSHYPQFQQYQMQMNIPGSHQFMQNAAQFSHQGLISRPSTSLSSIQNPMSDEQSAFLNSVAEQRNARNMEYCIAIERARQKKIGGGGRGYGSFNEDVVHTDPSQNRSRNTSMTSDNADCNNLNPGLIEMGPPGGPPMIHGHLHKPHISPMMHPSMMSPPPGPSSASSSSSMIRFGHPPPSAAPFFMPAVSLEQITDPKLMEKWVEFLKQQQQSTGSIAEANYEIQMANEQLQRQQQSVGRAVHDPGPGIRSMDDSHVPRQIQGRAPESRSVPGDENRVSSEPERPVAMAQSPANINAAPDSGTEKKSSAADATDSAQNGGSNKTKSLYLAEEDFQRADGSGRHTNRPKYASSKEYRSGKHNTKSEYTNVNEDYPATYRGEDEVAYEDYHVYKQHYPTERHRDHRSTHDYHRSYPDYQYYDESYNRATNDYGYKSNSLKYKSTKSKEYSKSSGSQIDCSQSDRGHSSSTKKSSTENQDYQHIERDNFEGQDWKSGKEIRRTAKSDSASYPSKRYETNRPYKDRSTEPTRQEFSMGFAVNPKESRRNNYYQGNYNHRYYESDYSQYFGNYSSTNNGSNCQQYDDNYYQSDNYNYSRQYKDQDAAYTASSGKNTKRPTKPGSTTTAEQWRSTKSDRTKYDSSFTKPGSRGNRSKSDKRQLSMSKECSNDNDQEEWATASEGGSERSNSVLRDGYKSSATRHQSAMATVDPQVDNEDASKRTENSNNGNQRSSENRFGSSNTCHGSWPSYPDEDGSDGASGSASGSRPAGTRSNLSTDRNKSTDSTQTRNTDNKSGANDSASKDGSNNNNSHKESPKTVDRHTRSYTDFIDMTKLSSVINVDKLPEVTEDEELLYENVGQFQEVLSKATKKNRKIEEQKRLKEEMELKRIEALRLKNRTDTKIIKRPVYRKEQCASKNDKLDNTVSHKVDTKPIPVSSRDKDSVTNNNNFKKYECNKVSMPIGSWDNSLADEINSDKKVPPKPIGTPAATSSWNSKVKSISKCNPATATTTSVLRGTTEIAKENVVPQSDAKTSQATKNLYLVTSESTDTNYSSSNAYSYNNTIFDRANDDKKIKDPMEPMSADIALPNSIAFDYDTKNISCDNKSKRNPLSSNRNVQKNEHQSLNDRLNFVKNIWDNQPAINVNTSESESVNRSAPSTNGDLDIHITTTSNDQDPIASRNIDVTPALSITNVCKVKPQLQQDFTKKDAILEPSLASSAFAIRNSPATFLAQNNQANFMPYTPRYAPELLQDHLHASDAFASLFSATQPSMHINYNLSNPHHLLDSSLLRQNAPDHLLTNKMNFISQQSFYPQAAVTPKLFSNAAGQLPLNMDMGSPHGALQQLLLTRQNSLTNMMQPNAMSIPFIQGGQQHTQTPLFPATPILGPNHPFTNPFTQAHLPAHYSPGGFPSFNHNPSFQQSQQMIINQQHHQQQQHHQHQQQMIQNQISHDRVINSGQSGIFNSIMAPNDMSTNTTLTDFNGQPKHLNQNNIMHGMNGSAIVLPHNLNIFMKPHIFATSSQYNSLQAPIQSSYPSLRNNYENHSSMKLGADLDLYKCGETSGVDRNAYCIDNYMDLSKQCPRDDVYMDHNDYDNCDMTTDNWTVTSHTNNNHNYRHNSNNNFVHTLDYQPQRSPIQLPIMDHQHNIGYNDVSSPSSYRYVRDNINYQTNNSSNYEPIHRNKQQLDQNYAATFVNADHTFANKNDINDNATKMSVPSTCEGAVVTDAGDSFSADIGNSEKSFSGKKKNSKQRSSFSDNFDEKNQSWSMVEDDSVDSVKLKCSATVDNCVNIEATSGSGHSPNKQYGYDETQLSSQTAESLSKYDSMQLKKMIMRLREGPVMTFANNFCNFDLAAAASPNVNNTSSVGHVPLVNRKTAVVPRLITPFQSSRNSNNSSNRPLHKSYNSHCADVHGPEFAGMGFYSRSNRALTPPPGHQHQQQHPFSAHTNMSTSLRNYKTRCSGSGNNSSSSRGYSHYNTSISSSSSHSNYRPSNTTVATACTAIRSSSPISTSASSNPVTTTISDEPEENSTTSDHHHHPLSEQLDECDSNQLIVDKIIDSAVL